MRAEIIGSFCSQSIVLFAFLLDAIRLPLEEGFGFESFVFMMVEHVRLQCFQKFGVHAAYAQAVKCIRKDRIFCFGNLERSPRDKPKPEILAGFHTLAQLHEIRQINDYSVPNECRKIMLA